MRHRVSRGALFAAAAAALVGVAFSAQRASVAGHPPTSFASRIAQLSERPGYFDTDNLISNEKSYLHVIPDLPAGSPGGAYIGVGPDQNFSYIARVKPSIAFIVDVRRDNLLLHLLFKALFELAPTRVEYLCLLVGRSPPTDIGELRDAPLAKIVEYVDSARPSTSAAIQPRIEAALARYGVPLSDQDRATLGRFHQRFADGGLSLQFESYGRTPRSYYPTYRELVLGTDREGRQCSYLATAADYAFVRALESKDLVIPVIGNLAGPSALAAIARLLQQRGDRLSAFYTSNVEFYLFGEGSIGRFVENLRRLPHTRDSLIVRSIFPAYGVAGAMPGYYSASVVQRVDTLLDGYGNGTIRNYTDLTRGR